MAEVFISYSQKDRALVAPIAERLTELGVDAWFDREISAGERFGAVIRAKLKEARAVLTCWSPDAVESDWVDAEADYARELGTYLPVFIAPCALGPPFNVVHAEDLSKWNGETNNPTWIKLVDQIARLIDRPGVAAAARILASGDEASRYDFARRYPEEPTAVKIWKAAETRHREQFEKRLAEAKAVAETRVREEHAGVEMRLGTAISAFNVWLANERSGAAVTPAPDPLDLVGPTEHQDEQRLRDDIAGLQITLAQGKARESAAQAEIARLSKALASLKASEQLDKRKPANRLRPRWISAAVAVFLVLSGLALTQSALPGLHTLAAAEDYAKARDRYAKAAAEGDRTAMYNLGVLSETGLGGPQDFAKAGEWYQKAATLGHVGAMTALGFLYETGHGEAKDAVKARDLYRQAADKGDGTVAYSLGVLDETTLVGTPDYEQALYWYREAAEAGDAKAMSRLAGLYLDGRAGEKDDAKAHIWFEKAANAGDMSAMYGLAVLYRNGRGGPQDFNKARDWFEKAANLGDMSAVSDLAALYRDGLGVPADDKKARELFVRAAEFGSLSAMLDLGIFYRDGRGGPQDEAQARTWFGKAADRGDLSSMVSLADLYSSGRGGAQDFALARNWYQRAADAGEASAMTKLGVLYDNGQGGTADYVAAVNLYQKAADKGEVTAMYRLGNHYLLEGGATMDYGWRHEYFHRAIAWYLKAAGKGDASAMRRLGDLYEEGLAVPQDFSKAAEWYKQAADLGDPGAKTNLGDLCSRASVKDVTSCQTR